MASMHRGVLLAKTSPAFLHANSTSHTWVFSAIAELIDNAYDPDVRASVLRIDIEPCRDGEICITFTDNGCGLGPDKLHNMLSFGYCEKEEVNGHKPVGQYGNGFKSGSMRIGRDAIVFTKTENTMSVGMLSQTYLERIEAETILVPIITWERNTMKIVTKQDTAGSQRSITGHSIYSTTTALLQQFDLIQHNTGTRIVIYNLRKGSDGKFELDFESNPADIINSEHHEIDAVYRPVVDYKPEYRRSLREYCSILFLKPRMKIFLRNKKVRTKLIEKSLKKMQIDFYRPRFLPAPVKITFGYGPTEDCGIMLYHRNRLIKAYEKVGSQKQWLPNQVGLDGAGTATGAGIVGVVEADFLDPIHNKQEFDKTDRYNTFMHALGAKVNDYRDIMSDSQTSTVNDSNPWTWAQCDKCYKWRRLPPGFDKQLPEVWFCYMNHDAVHNRCDIDEEPEDEDAIMQQSAKYKNMKMQKKSETERRSIISRQNKDAELEKKVQQLESEKQAVNQLAIVNLEQARVQLEEAQRREADQLRMIQMLERENRQWKEKQRSIGHDIMANDSCMANINSIARCGSRPSTAASNHTTVPATAQSQQVSAMDQQMERKRTAPDAVANTTSAAKKPCVNGELPTPSVNSANGVASLASHENEQEEELVDDKQAVRNATMIVRLPTQAPNALPSSVIVIDDSDDESETPLEIKPDKRQLDEQLTETTTSDVDAIDRKLPQISMITTLTRDHEHAASEHASHDHSRQNVDGAHRGKAKACSSDRRHTENVQPAMPATQCDNSLSSESQHQSSKHTPSATRSQNVKAVGKSAGKRLMTDRHMQTEVTMQDVGIQTETCSSSSEQQLASLRNNVLQLLKTIVPTLSCNNLEFVDELVVEMVRVNSENSDIDE